MTEPVRDEFGFCAGKATFTPVTSNSTMRPEAYFRFRVRVVSGELIDVEIDRLQFAAMFAGEYEQPCRVRIVQTLKEFL